MLLENKNVIVYGGAGAVGGAVARTFATEGARIFLAGRTLSALQTVAADIEHAGGAADASQVDALDEGQVEDHATQVAARVGQIHIVVNAVGFPHGQGAPLAELTLDDVAPHVDRHIRTTYLTARAAHRHMAPHAEGVILNFSTPGARLSGPGFLANGVASAAVEGLCRILAGEVGPDGIRVVCLRPDAIPEALATSHTGPVFADVAQRHGTTADALLAERARTAPLLKRLPTLQEVADTAAFVASDRGGAITGSIINLTCGSLVD